MRKRNGEAVSYQVAGADETVETPKKESYTETKTGTFNIKVTSDEIDPETKEKKVLYENKEESFIYPQVIGGAILNVFRDSGANFDSSQEDFFTSIFKPTLDEAGVETENSKTIGEAVKSLVTLYNNKLKADAKSNAYQALVNKYKPLEGEKKESAQARLVANFIKLAGVSKEIAVEILRSNKALPEDYTVADFDATPLRRTKNEDSE